MYIYDICIDLRILVSNTISILDDVTRRMSRVEQELLTLPGHLSSPPLLVRFVLLDISVLCNVL
jgi:hypothetical protein